MQKAIGYVRVSTEEQARSGLGLAAQEERIRAYATATGLDLVAIVRDEGVSGSVPIEKRTGGLEVLAALRKRKAGHVVALKLDRVFRDAADCLNQTKVWDKAGVALHLLDMGGQAINTASAMGRMFLTMAAGFAELERNLCAERTRDALAVKRQRGEAYNHAPFGFRREGDLLVEEPDAQEAIRLIHKLRADGRSYRAIASELERRGVQTAKGGTWAAMTVRNIAARAAA